MLEGACLVSCMSTRCNREHTVEGVGKWCREVCWPRKGSRFWPQAAESEFYPWIVCHNFGIKGNFLWTSGLSILLARSKVTATRRDRPSMCWVNTITMHQAGCYTYHDYSIIFLSSLILNKTKVTITIPDLLSLGMISEICTLQYVNLNYGDIYIHTLAVLIPCMRFKITMLSYDVTFCEVK